MSGATIEELLQQATAAVPEFSLSGKTLPAKVVACYDGDTFHAVIPVEAQMWKFSCRMAGYDTPEMKPPANMVGREAEKARAIRAKQALISHVCSGPVSMETDYGKKGLDDIVTKNTKIIQLVCKEFDKYGRLLVEVPLEGGWGSGTVNEWMVKNGYGYSYDGGKKVVAAAGVPAS